MAVKCSVSLPHGAIGWSVIVEFPDHTHLLFYLEIILLIVKV